MKAKAILAGLFLSLALISCKNGEKKEEKKSTEVVEKKSNTFDVSVDLIMKSKDELQLYFQDEKIPWFSEEYVVWGGGNGSDEVQTISFSVPEQYVPTNVRLDISRNKEQKSVVIKKIKFSYLGKSFEINGSELLNYFEPNEFIKYDPTTSTAFLSTNSKGEFDPFFSGKESIFPKIRMITGKK